MRKILYSPGYGAGWTSWEGNQEVKKFMLEYKPFIDYLEGGGKFEFDDAVAKEIDRLSERIITDVRISKDFGMEFHWERMERNIPPLVFQFARECYDRFKTIPFLGGLEELKVKEVQGRVRIEDYDGFESIEEEGDFNEWL